MKTKNIFRMLFLTVALIVGSNVESAETVIWEGTFNQYSAVAVGSDKCGSLTSGQKLRIYVFNRQLHLKGGWSTANFGFKDSPEGYLDFSSFYEDEGYFEAVLDQAAITLLTNMGSEPFVLEVGSDMTVTRITHVDADGNLKKELLSSVSLNDTITSWSISDFGQREAGDAIRVYTTFTKAGSVRPYGNNGKGNLKSSNDGWIECSKTDALRGYVDIELSDEEIAALKDNYDLCIAHQNIGVKKISISDGGITPATPTHTLTISIDGQTQTKTVAEGMALTDVLPTPTKEGYTFTGWSGLPDNGQMGTSDLTVTAVFTVNSYALTFKIDGQEDQTSMVEYGTDITYPANPTKEGYTFTGWDNNPSTMPANDLTITALFKKTFVLRTGELIVWDGTPDIQHGYEENLFVNNTNDWVASTEEGGILRIYADIDNANDWKLWTGGGNWNHPTFVDVPSADITNTSTHTGYNATAGCFEFVFNENTKQNLQNAINDGRAMSISFRNITIYQVTYQSVPKHTLTISIDDQTTTMEVAEGTTVNDLLPANPTKTGYAFKGWSGIPDDGKMPTSDLTLTAQFAIVYKVEIAATTYGIITTDKEAYEEGETVTVTIIANNGYEMNSISTDPKSSDLKRVDDGVFSFTMPASDVKVTVRFNAKQYTLTFMLNGEVYVVNENVRYGDNIVLPQDPEVEEGFSFPGWIDVPETMPADNFTIYGHYIATLSVGESGYATYCPMKPIFFQGNENVKAFIAKEKSATEVTLKQVRGAVAAGTGLVLKGEPGAEAVFDVTNEGTSYSGTNMMVGVTDTNATINEAYLYVLVQKTDGVKFADTAANAAIVPVGKAYLHAPANSSRILTISFDDETTAMKGVNAAETEAPTAVYNLSGQRVTSPKAGLYIMNGKKVVIK